MIGDLELRKSEGRELFEEGAWKSALANDPAQGATIELAMEWDRK